MNIYRGSRVINGAAKAFFVGLTLIQALVITAGLSGCAQPAALKTVTDQNATNTSAYAANVSTLANAARELARIQTNTMVFRSRERVSADLIRIRATILPSQPTEAELADAGVSWATALAQEVGGLAARVNAAPPDQRLALAAALADDHPATIDLAIGTPGFSIARVLRDSVELDRANTLIEAEPNAAIRSAMLTRRNAILDPYLAAKSAGDASARYLAAVDRFISTLDEQGRILGLHAVALGGYASGPPARGTVLGTFQNADLRAAALDLVSRTWGTRAADDLRDRLLRADEAIGVVSALATH